MEGSNDTYEHYKAELDEATDAQKKFYEEGDKAWREYTLRSSDTKEAIGQAYPLFWANIRTLRPNIFFQAPEVAAERRNYQKDPVSLKACSMLESNTAYNLHQQPFAATIRRAVTDLLVPGRGAAWIELDTKFEQERFPVMQDGFGNLLVGGQPVDPEIEEFEETEEGTVLLRDKIGEQLVRVIHVNWKDFFYSCARTWEEVYWVARNHWLTRTSLEKLLKNKRVKNAKRILETLKYDYGYGDKTKAHKKEEISRYGRARIVELWDKERRKVVWFVPDGDRGEILFEEEPPINFRDFFPCPPPLFATLGPDNLIPTPDYAYYKDQNRQTEELTENITGLISQIQWKGIYNPTFADLIKNLMENQGNGTFEPAKEWSTLIQQGGFEGNIITMPLDKIAEALTQSLVARQTVKAEADEVAGIMDLWRGQGSPQSTATRDNIRDQKGNQRLAEAQDDIQTFIAKIVSMTGEAIAELFTDENLILISGEDPNDPLVQQALQLLRDDKLRTVSLVIETDSTLKPNQQRERADAIEFLNVFRDTLNSLVGVRQQAPEAIEAMTSLIMFVVRRFQAGRAVEAQIEQAFEAMVEQVKQPPAPPPPDPMVELKAKEVDIKGFDAETKRMSAETDRVAADIDALTKGATIETERLKAAAEVVKNGAEGISLEPGVQEGGGNSGMPAF